MKQLILFTAFLCFTATVFCQAFTSSNLPIVVINTNGQPILDDPKIMADMGIIYNGEGVRNSVTDPSNHYNGKVGIEVRGQSSQMFPMKSYGFELWDNDGESVDQSLFGLPAESDWILYAPYNEKTLQHNFLAYTLSRGMGHWAANCRYVELVLNGEYRGIYVFMERIKRNAGRVNVPKISSSAISGDEVTGGYIFSIDKDADGWYSSYPPNPWSGATIRFSHVYPKESALVPEQKAYLKSFVDSFENALSGALYQDPVNGWRRFADEPSFQDYFLLNELSRNVDGLRISTYFHKNKKSKGGKIIAGPVWDYDLAFRNADYCDGSLVTGWAYQFNNVCGNDFWQVPFWWGKLMTDTSFRSGLRCRWQQLRQGLLHLPNLYRTIDSVAALSAEARGRHFAKWPVLGQYIWPNPQPIANTYAEEITTLKNWLEQRINWLDANLPQDGSCAPFNFPTDEGSSLIVRIYDNPSSADATIRLDSRIAQSVRVHAFDNAGKLVYAARLSLTAGLNTAVLPSGKWSSGVYVLKFITADNDVISEKLVRQF